MSVQETLRWLFPSWHVFFFGFVMIAGAFLISRRLNGQTMRNKLVNSLKIGLALYGASGWFSVNAIVNREPQPFRSFALLTVVFVYYLIGDWLAFWWHYLIIWSEHRNGRAHLVTAPVQPAALEVSDTPVAPPEGEKT